MPLALPTDAAAPPENAWGPMLVVALVVLAIVAMVVGFGRITRRRRPDDRPGDGADTTPANGTTTDLVPTDPTPDPPEDSEEPEKPTA